MEFITTSVMTNMTTMDVPNNNEPKLQEVSLVITIVYMSVYLPLLVVISCLSAHSVRQEIKAMKNAKKANTKSGNTRKNMNKQLQQLEMAMAINTNGSNNNDNKSIVSDNKNVNNNKNRHSNSSNGSPVSEHNNNDNENENDMKTEIELKTQSGDIMVKVNKITVGNPSSTVSIPVVFNISNDKDKDEDDYRLKKTTSIKTGANIAGISGQSLTPINPTIFVKKNTWKWYTPLVKWWKEFNRKRKIYIALVCDIKCTN